MGIKNAEFNAYSESAEKVAKNLCEKSDRKWSFGLLFLFAKVFDL
jgi:hypothetical protein